MLVESDVNDEKTKEQGNVLIQSSNISLKAVSLMNTIKSVFNAFSRHRSSMLDHSGSLHDTSVKPRVNKRRSAAALIGAYMNFEEGETTEQNADVDGEFDKQLTVEDVLMTAIEERKWSDRARKMFQALDVNHDGVISFANFVNGANKVKLELSVSDYTVIFSRYDIDGNGHLTYDQFVNLLRTTDLTKEVKVPPSNKDSRGLVQIDANQEKYFGETIGKYNNAGKQQQNTEIDFMLARNQHFIQELYETRIASLQRFVAMVVMFHQMGKRVQGFFETISFGVLGYRMDRTHSIMRIATTASPISGADVRQRMLYLQLLKKVRHSIHIISHAYLTYKSKKEVERVKTMEKQLSTALSSGDELAEKG
jgi:EF-hand domain pair